jgi:hypothetical protein
LEILLDIAQVFCHIAPAFSCGFCPRGPEQRSVGSVTLSSMSGPSPFSSGSGYPVLPFSLVFLLLSPPARILAFPPSAIFPGCGDCFVLPPPTTLRADLQVQEERFPRAWRGSYPGSCHRQNPPFFSTARHLACRTAGEARALADLAVPVGDRRGQRRAQAQHGRRLFSKLRLTSPPRLRLGRLVWELSLRPLHLRVFPVATCRARCETRWR